MKGGEERMSPMRLATKLEAWQDDRAGQGLVEYALILALIAVVAIVALLFLGEQVSTTLSIVGSAI
jgi:pilus assembly protein Flp/PilA